MSRAFSLSPLLYPNSITPPSGLIVKISATATRNVGMSVRSLVVKPPSHPTYDLKGFIQLALSEDAGDRGDVTCKATVPAEMEMEAEAHFLAKEDGIEAGIALAKKVFGEVDPSLKAMADAARPAYILETRKTAPGLRLVDKWAVS